MDSFFVKGVIFATVVPLFIFTVLFIHEAGHYLAARFFRVQITRVAFGCGKEIWKRKDRRGTQWSVKAFPLWAQVNLAGWEDGKAGEPVTFGHKHFWQRLITIVAGPLANMVAPFFLFACFFAVAGQPSIPTIITGIYIGKAADKAGFMLGDQIIGINGKSVHTRKEMTKLAHKKPEKALYTILRGGREIEISATPDWLEYDNIDRIKRKHYRSGIVLQHKPYNMDVLRHINGEPVKDDPDKARTLLLQNLGREIVLGLHSTEGKTKDTRIFLFESSNAHLNQPDHDDYDLFYISKAKDNIYIRRTLGMSIYEAASLNLTLIKKIAGVPFQVLPIDPEIVRRPAPIHDKATWLQNEIYHLFYVISVISVFMGLINLLPLPNLDGGHLLTLLYEAVTHKPLAGKKQVLLFVGIFILFYLAIFISNMDNIPHYIDSRIKKVQEFLDDK